jgi:hypothetical protein
MTAESYPVLVCARDVNTLAEVRRVLAGGGLEVAGRLLDGPDPVPPFAGAWSSERHAVFAGR